ncbi:MAG: HDIG domain-containing metalloprotein, partial [Phycisphaerales bacterium]
ADFEAFSTAARRAVAVPPRADGSGPSPRLASVGRGAIELRADDPPSMRARLGAEATEAGFPIELAQPAVAPILADPKPTIAFDAAATKAAEEEAAEQAAPVQVVHPRGEALYAPGDVLTAEQVTRAHAEHVRHRGSESHPGVAMPFTAAAALALGIGVLAAIFLAQQAPDVFRRWRRLASALGLVLLPAAVVAVMVFAYPRAVGFAAIGAALLAAGIATVAFGLRVSLVTVLAQQPLALAIAPGTAWIAALAGPVIYAALLRDVRHRSTLVTASVAAALISAGAVLVGAAAPGAGDPATLSIALGESLIALVTALFVGFLMIGLLPTIERFSGQATGLTLVELRDPKHPLLRELQRRAPGTWNHSLQVANIAEAAAESIGADGLLAYVGALYHDIGKINKPEYFVENQSGTNRHDRLSPAMSLLVIVGHVKDGMELGAEFRLPAQVRHFIESHHGTTLMEYFFRAAQKRAGEDEINEADFRYPGPKPATREAAVLMLCDCVESASRTLSEPTPARIEQLVRDLSHRRLVDGQFDDSPLTLRELRAVEDSIIKSLNAIYHGRISYPSLRGEARDDRPLPRVAS